MVTTVSFKTYRHTQIRFLRRVVLVVRHGVVAPGAVGVDRFERNVVGMRPFQQQRFE